jgi:hypothetical protein
MVPIKRSMLVINYGRMCIDCMCIELLVPTSEQKPLEHIGSGVIVTPPLTVLCHGTAVSKKRWYVK